jgi:membrane protease YdiL (CAAX protease family)
MMPPVLQILRALINILIAGTFAGMVVAQFWALTRLWSGNVSLPPPRPVASRWGLGTVLLVFLGYVVLQFALKEGYLALRDRQGVHASPAPRLPEKIATPHPATATDQHGRDLTEARQRVAGTADPELSFTEVIVLGSSMNTLAIVLVPLTLWLTSRSRPADLGLTVVEFWFDVRTGAFTFLLVTPWVYGVNLLATLVFESNHHPLEDMLRKEWGPATALLAVVSAVALAPVTEELLFRGVLLRWLNRIAFDDRRRRRAPASTQTELSEGPDSMWRSTAVSASGLSPSVSDPLSAPPRDDPSPARTVPELPPVITTSVLFALLHVGQMPAPFAIFALSIALGLLAQRTGRLTASITLHALFNGFSTLALLAALLRSPTLP